MRKPSHASFSWQDVGPPGPPSKSFVWARIIRPHTSIWRQVDSSGKDPVDSQESWWLAVGWHWVAVQRGLLHCSHNPGTTPRMFRSYQLSHLSPGHCPDKATKPTQTTATGLSRTLHHMASFLGQSCSETCDTHGTALLFDWFQLTSKGILARKDCEYQRKLSMTDLH